MEPKQIAYVNTKDPKLNYGFVNPHWQTLAIHRVHDDTRLDFNIPRTKDAIKKGHTQDLPLSFFQISEGDIVAGKKWYEARYPKLGEELALLMARYNWGDLKYATKKSLRNHCKKVRRKTGRKPKISFQLKPEPIIISLN